MYRNIYIYSIIQPYIFGIFDPLCDRFQISYSRSPNLSCSRVQISAAHSSEEIDTAVAAFVKVGKELGVVA